MSRSDLIDSLRRTIEQNIPLPGSGQTAARHMRLMDVGRQDLVLARLAEAHWDAVAILAEVGREPKSSAIYGVWASEAPGQPLRLHRAGECYTLRGIKRFCSGAGIADRALITVTEPEQILCEIDLRRSAGKIEFDESGWKSPAFQKTHTATATFHDVPVCSQDIIGEQGWYLNRIGFWWGACGPAACWAGGAEGLADYASRQSRDDPHTLAHLGAMRAAEWGLRSCLSAAGRAIDESADTPQRARILALALRHLVEQLCSDILRRLTRAYGPHALIFDEEIYARYQELDLYLRQSHAERDLELLGRELHSSENQSALKSNGRPNPLL